jgi:hypothetical protein
LFTPPLKAAIESPTVSRSRSSSLFLRRSLMASLPAWPVGEPPS